MEYFAYAFQPIVVLLAFTFLHAVLKIVGRVRPKKSNKKTIIGFPEPSGALPIIGHLHLLGGNNPVVRILGAMADKHGPIFSLRLGQKRTLVVSSWEVVKECFTTNDRIFANRPSIAVGKLIAGKRFSASMYEEKNSEVTRLNNAIKETLYLSGVFVWSDAIPWLEWLDIHGHVRSMKRTFKEIDFVLSKWLEEHRERKRSENCSANCVERDLMDVMLSTLAEEDVMSAGHTRDTVIKATALILTLTGTESTAVTLTWTLSLLLNNPSALKSAQEELDTQVGRDRWVQESDIHNLKYLQAVVKESLRLNPAGPITGPREATEDCYIGNHFVPKGTRLAVNIWKLQRDPQIWSDPCEFRPERFMTTHADLGLKGQNFEYIPFSSGRRSCPGMTLGLIVVQGVLARLLQGFDIRTKGGEPVDMREGLGIALPKASPLEVVLAPRLPLQLYECL
ncbi:hypothetical protein FNV43_RR23029 [Rhamnella rubrinervis]|uniref:Cytochrome P450 n=1 Tax=Rhamnella rubrinervis TaxID=2594499 RepID=A0A8K0E311_9ROSA|nr:hypothetical protein FNV43_RR23029 [Rhamnella rubrinervis]